MPQKRSSKDAILLQVMLLKSYISCTGNISGFVSEVPGQVVLSLHDFRLLDANADRISTSHRNEKAKLS